MKYRKLRIAFSATCLIACVLLIALWVRSYAWLDVIGGRLSDTDALRFQSISGELSVSWGQDKNLSRWKWQSRSAKEVARKLEKAILAVAKAEGTAVPPPSPSFAFFRSGQTLHIHFPHWILVLVLVITTALSGAPWIRRRFSLRTLLIATTLVAVVLGAIVYASR